MKVIMMTFGRSFYLQLFASATISKFSAERATMMVMKELYVGDVSWLSKHGAPRMTR